MAEVREALRETRRLVVESAARHGVAVMAASSHPFARWQAQLVTPRQRYERFAVTFQESMRSGSSSAACTSTPASATPIHGCGS